MTGKVLYVARHDQVDSNDDEGAVSYALEQLGWEVTKVNEGNPLPEITAEFSFCLFHKWSQPSVIETLWCPAVFWYFDLVTWPSDATLHRRSSSRMDWMKKTLMLKQVEVGFCTDGDWVAEDKTGKLVCLRQGCDERVTGVGDGSLGVSCDVLFTGISNLGGTQRRSFVDDVSRRYGTRFRHYPNGLHGPSLRNQIAAAKVVVCPDSPVTDRYWSNRVYQAMGFGGMVLHPYTKGLADEVQDGDGIVYYHDRADLFDKIDHYVSPLSKDENQRCRKRALKVAEGKLTYRHRVESMLHHLKVRGVIK